MPEPVVGLHRILAHNVVWSMTIVAGRHRVVAGLHPGIVLRLHHVAIRAGSGIIRQIGVSLGIHKGKGGEPNGHTQNHRRKQTDCDRAPHRIIPFSDIEEYATASHLRRGISLRHATLMGRCRRPADPPSPAMRYLSHAIPASVSYCRN